MSSPKRLFEKTASKRPRRDSDEKQEHSPRQNVGRNISTPRAKKPAFNPALLSSAFYSGPTMYGGAGASNSSPYNQYAKSKFYDRKKTDIKVTPSAPDNSMSQTSRRILDFLEQYSSPISDAKRVPINKPLLACSAKKPIVHQSFLDCTVRSSPDDASTPSGSRPNRFRELQIPSMATLMKMKRNNCNVSPAISQTPITASLSSSLTYKPATYSLKDADSGKHKNKIRTKLNRRTDRFSDEELPEPVNLPNISLNMTGVKLPTFTMRPFNVSDADTKQYTPSKIPDTAPVTGSTGGFKFGRVGAQPFQATRKFFFRDPLDILSSKYGVSPGREDENVKTHDGLYGSNTLISLKSKRVFEESDKDEPTLKHHSNKSAQMWNGNDKTGKDCDKPPTLVNGDVRKDSLKDYDSPTKGKNHLNNNDDNLMSVNPKTDKTDSAAGVKDLTDFIKKQKSQSWECSTCMTRNDNDKLKCVCCEAAKVDGKETKPADTPKNTTLSSGLVDFMKKQSSQWECNSCMTRNDSDKIKCVCCEVARAGATAAQTSVASSFVYPGMVNFMKKQSAQWECSSCMTRNNDDRIKCVCCEATKPGHEPEKSAANFSFGSVQTANFFKFGIDQADAGKSTVTDTKPAPEEDKKTSAPATGFVFGNTTEVKSDSPKVGGFTFGIANGSPAITKESSAPNPANIFGEKKESSPAPASIVPAPAPAPAPSPITFGIKKPEVEPSNIIVSSSTPDIKTNTFTFSSPKPTISSLPVLKNDSEKIQGGFGSSLTGLPPPASANLVGVELSTVNSTATKSATPPFTFGSPQTTKLSGGFGGSTPFQFGAAAANTSTSAFKPPAVPFTFGAKDPVSNASAVIKPAEPAVSGAEALFRIPSTNTGGSLFSVPTTSSSSNQNILKDKITTGSIASPLQFPSAIQAIPDKSKDNPTATNFFNFGSPAPDTNAANSGSFKAAAPAGPVFTFGSNAAVKSDTTFGSSSVTPAVSLFGAKPITESEPSNSPSSAMFKPAATASPFAPSTNLFGTSPLTVTQPPVHAVFGANPLGQAANKPASGIFGSPAAPQSTSLFPGVSAATPTFSSGNIFGSAPRSNPVAQPSAGPFGSQPLNKTETSTFMNNANSSGNLFGASASPAAPSASTGGLFGSGGAAPTPVFGAAIPFGEAARAQPSQGVGFTFGAANSTMGFGRPPGPPPVYSFGSQSAAPPPSGSQFNFTMGASASGFNPGVNPNGPQRKMKKAVRRTMR